MKVMNFKLKNKNGILQTFSLGLKPPAIVFIFSYLKTMNKQQELCERSIFIMVRIHFEI